MIGRRVTTPDDLERAGDYCLTTVHYDDGSRPHLWFLLPIHEGETRFDHPTPGSGMHGISSPPWTFRECPDGSIEVRASVLCWDLDDDGNRVVIWHGFLNEGHHWREVA